jgi:hypothetical protein
VCSAERRLACWPHGCLPTTPCIVLIVERDDVKTQGNPAVGVSQDRQAHAPPPGGLAQIERWLPGTTCEASPWGTYMPVLRGAVERLQVSVRLSISEYWLYDAIRLSDKRHRCGA